MPNLFRLRRSRRSTTGPDARARSRGQSLVEFALFVPVVLGLVGGAADMGRLFYAYVAIENAAKEGAAYGATNPRCDVIKAGCFDPNTVSWRFAQEVSGLSGVTRTVSCIEEGVAIPVEDCYSGDQYVVTARYTFAFITPLLTPLFGGSLELRTSAQAMVLNTAFDPDSTPVPGPTPTPTPTPPPSNAPSPTPTPTPSPSQLVPTPTPAPTIRMCTTPNFIGTKRNQAVSRWRAAGFTGTIALATGSGNYVIRNQTREPGSSQPCTATITVGP